MQTPEEQIYWKWNILFNYSRLYKYFLSTGSYKHKTATEAELPLPLCKAKPTVYLIWAFMLCQFIVAKHVAMVSLLKRFNFFF